MSTFQKPSKRLAPENLSEIEVHNCRCHFRGFQLELHIVDTKNFEIGSVVAKLQLSEVICPYLPGPQTSTPTSLGFLRNSVHIQSITTCFSRVRCLYRLRTEVTNENSPSGRGKAWCWAVVYMGFRVTGAPLWTFYTGKVEFSLYRPYFYQKH